MEKFIELIEDYKKNANNLIYKELINLGYRPKVKNGVIIDDIKKFLIENNIEMIVEYDTSAKILRGVNAINNEILFEYEDRIEVDLGNNRITSYFYKTK